MVEEARLEGLASGLAPATDVGSSSTLGERHGTRTMLSARCALSRGKAPSSPTSASTCASCTPDVRKGCTTPSPPRRTSSSLPVAACSLSKVRSDGAALMAEDIHYDAARRLPRALRTGYVAYAHDTNTARDPRACYRCAISNKFIIREGHPVRRTRALCTNVKATASERQGDSFLYVFDMAELRRLHGRAGERLTCSACCREPGCR
jgi:hypothetical protein